MLCLYGGAAVHPAGSLWASRALPSVLRGHQAGGEPGEASGWGNWGQPVKPLGGAMATGATGEASRWDTGLPGRRLVCVATGEW